MTKEEAIIKVIDQRVEVLDKIIPNCMSATDAEWYKGRRTGLMDVRELLTDTLECIQIEIYETESKQNPL